MIETILKLDGMSCPMCEAHLNEIVRKQCNPRKVTSSYKRNECVFLTDMPIEYLGLKSAIHSTGYNIIGLDSHEYVKKGFFAGLFG